MVDPPGVGGSSPDSGDLSSENESSGDLRKISGILLWKEGKGSGEIRRAAAGCRRKICGDYGLIEADFIYRSVRSGFLRI